MHCADSRVTRSLFREAAGSNVGVKESAKMLAVVFALGFLGGSGGSLAESPLTGANPDRAKAAIEYIRSVPAFKMRYHVGTGILKDKLIEFRFSRGRFAFVWLTAGSGDVYKMYSYDGARYYSLLLERQLTVSRDPVKGQDIARSWVTYNPIYNVFKYINPGAEPFTPAVLAGAGTAEKAADLISHIDGDGKSQFNKTKGSGYYSFSGSFPLPSEIEASDPKAGTLKWKINDFFVLKSAVSGDPFLIPKEIECVQKDVFGRLIPSS
jgi:hypothetical protein